MPRRAVITALAGIALFVLAGCSSAPPQVTFSVGDVTVQAGPTQYCEDDFVTCVNHPDNPVELPVPPGTPLDVAVPEEVSSTPWQVVYRYRDAAGEEIGERSAVQAPGAASTYSLVLSDPAARLLTAQVQQYGPPPELNQETGEVEFPIRSSWVFIASAS